MESKWKSKDFIRHKNVVASVGVAGEQCALPGAARRCVRELCNFISICDRKEFAGATERWGGEGGSSTGWHGRWLLRRLHIRGAAFFRHPPAGSARHYTLTPLLRIQAATRACWLNYFSIIWFATSFNMAEKTSDGGNPPQQHALTSV